MSLRSVYFITLSDIKESDINFQVPSIPCPRDASRVQEFERGPEEVYDIVVHYIGVQLTKYKLSTRCTCRLSPRWVKVFPTCVQK